MYFLEKQLKTYQTFSLELLELDIPGTYKFYYNGHNSSKTALNSVFF